MSNRLYHGTSADALPRIKTFGLQGRKYTKAPDNWKHTVSSNAKAVYLTDAYAWHFAAACSGSDSKGLILEIDKDALLPWKLCPDEDFLEQATRKIEPTPENGLAPITWDMKRRTRFYRGRAERMHHLGEKSLEYMGTCAYYGAIPWGDVTRYVVIDWTRLDLLMRIQAGDSMVSCMNYKILQERHRAFTRWFFGDSVTPAEVAGNVGYAPIEGSDDYGLAKMRADQNARYADAMANREGLTVVNLKGDNLAKSA